LLSYLPVLPRVWMMMIRRVLRDEAAQARQIHKHHHQTLQSAHPHHLAQLRRLPRCPPLQQQSIL
jgi:hypothetical protein